MTSTRWPSDKILQQVTLERFRFTTESRYPQFALNDLSCDFSRCVDADDMACRISNHVYGQVVQDETVKTSVSVPSDWWQHVKGRWFTVGMLRRWPVTLTTVTDTYRFRTVALLPEFKYQAPKGERFIMMTELTKRA